LEFIYEKRLFPELEYIFKHALIQEVAYNSLLIKRRKEIHERNSKIIEFFKDKDEVRVTSAAGSDFTYSVKGRVWFNNLHYTHSPLYKKEGWLHDWGKDFRFPDLLGYSEATVSPVPGSVNGTYVVTDWMSGAGNVLLQALTLSADAADRQYGITLHADACRQKRDLYFPRHHPS
jgi:leucyl aminopeptidase (aminopeptidase T)